MEFKDELKELILEMRAAFFRGENAMEHARKITNSDKNSVAAALIAYDLQAGSYIEAARNDPSFRKAWCGQIAEIIERHAPGAGSILEAGCGEATTLTGVYQAMKTGHPEALGFDISWSRINKGNGWLAEQKVPGHLFVADLFGIPLADDSIDVVYTSHSLEPNGGRETEAIRELLRVAGRMVVLVEPLYELAGEEAKRRMEHHGYARGLLKAAEHTGARILEYRLLGHIANPLNPSGVIVIEKQQEKIDRPDGKIRWQCPLTATPLENLVDVYYSKEAGVAYPVLRNIPVLMAANAVVASNL